MPRSSHDPVLSERDLFLHTLELDDSAQRKLYLDTHTHENPELRKRLETLLNDASESSLFLDPARYQSLENERESLFTELDDSDRFIGTLGNSVHTLGDYKLIERIGRGSVGIVFRAQQISLDREVAVKIIVGAALASPSERQRFRSEAAAAAQLTHKHIVPVYETGSDEEYDYFSMALIGGGTLKDLIQDSALPPRKAATLMLKIAEAIQAAHQLGIIHRDLKPENILLDEAGEPYVSDFGLASRLEQSSQLTLTGQIMGTPQYMAPEQAAANPEQLTTSADLYSLGAIFYELLTGEPPFRGKGVLQTLQLVREASPRPLRSLRPEIPRDLETITLKCLEKEASRRYATTAAFAQDLESWLSHRPIAARPPGLLERIILWGKRRPLHAALALLTLVFILTLGIAGPLVALQQSQLRKEAEEAKEETQQERTAALQTARRNRNLAYSFSTRLTSIAIAKAEERFSLAPHAMLDAWQTDIANEDPRGWEWFYLFAKVYQQPSIVSKSGKPCRWVGFSPEGKRFAVIRENHPGMIIRDSFHTAVIHHLGNDTVNYQTANWHPGGSHIATLTETGSIDIWDATRGTLTDTLQSSSPIQSLTWHPNSPRLSASHGDGSIRTWEFNTTTGEANSPTSFHTEITGLNQLSWSPDEQFLAASDATSDVLLWERHQLDRPPLRLRGHSAPVTMISWHHNGKWLATLGRDSLIRVWEIPGGARLLNLKKREAPITDMAWDTSGFRLMYTETANSSLHLFSMFESAVYPSNVGAKITTFDWSPGIHSIVMGDAQGMLKVKRFELPKTRQIIAKGLAPVNELTWNTEGTLLRLSIPGQDSQIINTLEAGTPLLKTHPESINWFLPQDLPNLPPAIQSSSPTVASGHPSGSRIATGHSNGSIRIWDSLTTSMALKFNGSVGRVTALAWDPRGIRLAVAGKSGKVIIFDASLGIVLSEEAK